MEKQSISTITIRSLKHTIWAGETLEMHEVIDSTNLRAKQLALENAPHGTLVMADVQTKGRGRMQRTWQASSGEALLMSILVRPRNLLPEYATGIVLLGAIAVSRALERIGLSTRIKWPNDIVCGGKKLCGMLLEMGLEQNLVSFAVLGVGINVKSHPVSAETPHAGSVCEALGHAVPREALAAAFLDEFEAVYDRWAAHGMEAVLPEYCERLITLNSRVRVLAVDGSEQEGVAAGVQEDGALVIRLDDGKQTIVHAGDVSVRGVMGYV